MFFSIWAWRFETCMIRLIRDYQYYYVFLDGKLLFKTDNIDCALEIIDNLERSLKNDTCEDSES